MPEVTASKSALILAEFQESRRNLQKAVDKFGKAFESLLEASKNPEVKEGDDILRKAVNRSIRILADQSGMAIHTVWVLAYHELFKKTGFHAVVENSTPNGKHLDKVQEAGKLEDLMEVVKDMLMSDEFSSIRRSHV